jgi:uncharacterized membrane protein YwzB
MVVGEKPVIGFTSFLFIFSHIYVFPKPYWRLSSQVINSFIKQTIMKKFIYCIFLISISLTAQSQNVGVNTDDPQATLHVKGSGATDPFMVEYGDSIKVKTFQNGGTSVGSGTIPPENGLYVKGTLQPDSGIITPKKLIIESVGNSITMKAGQSTVVIDANGNITITTHNGITAPANIVIQSDGNLNLSGNTLNLTGNLVNINATTALTIKSNASTEISGVGPMDIKASLLRLNDGGNPVAKLGSTTFTVSGGAGFINGNISSTILVP